MLFNYLAEALGGMSKETFMLKYDGYMVNLRDKLIAENKPFIGITVDVEGWLYSLNLPAVNKGLKKLDKLKRPESKMDCIDDILSILMANDIDFSEHEDKIKDLAFE